MKHNDDRELTTKKKKYRVETDLRIPSEQEQVVGMRTARPDGRMRLGALGWEGSKELAARRAKGSVWKRAASSATLRSV